MVTAQEAAEYTGAELKKLLEDNCDPNGDFIVPIKVEEWFALPSPTRHLLQERLDQQKEALVGSSSVDAAELSTLLEQIPPESNDRDLPSPKHASSSSKPTPVLDEDEWERSSERVCYDLLIADGGRPCYAIEKLEAVVQDPDAHAQWVEPWRHLDISINAPTEWQVFERQLFRWGQYWDWQLEHRNLEDEHSFDKYLEQEKAKVRPLADRSEEHAELLKLHSKPVTPRLHDRWRRGKAFQKRKRKAVSNGSQVYDGFSDYSEAVRRCLEHHGVVASIELDINPKKQGPLTTWAEYVHFEFWWLTAYERAVDGADTHMRETWQKYRDMGLFTDDETLDALKSIRLSYMISQELRDASEHTRTIELTLNTLRRRILEDPSDTNKEGKSELEAAKKKMNEAVERQARANDREQASVKIFKGGKFRKYAEYLKSQKLLFQWALDQLQVVAAESGVSMNTNTVGPGQRKTKSNRLTHGIHGKKVRFLEPSVIQEYEGLGTSPTTAPTEATVKSLSTTGVRKRKVGIDDEARSTDHRSKSRRVASPDSSATQDSTGVSITMNGLGVSRTAKVSSEAKIPAQSQGDPIPTINLGSLRKRKAKDNDSCQSATFKTRKKRVALLQASTIQNSTTTSTSAIGKHDATMSCTTGGLTTKAANSNHTTQKLNDDREENSKATSRQEHV